MWRPGAGRAESWRLGQRASGALFRVHNLADPVGTGMEIQILDDAAYGVKWDAMNANGALYDLVHPGGDANVSPGQWNRAHITVNNSLVAAELNGKEVVRADPNQWTKPNQNPDGTHSKFPQTIGALPHEGFIGLQNYGATPVWFRNVRLKARTDRRPQYTGQEPISAVLRTLPWCQASGAGRAPNEPTPPRGTAAPPRKRRDALCSSPTVRP